jgi:hypothetical protein
MTLAERGRDRGPGEVTGLAGNGGAQSPRGGVAEGGRRLTLWIMCAIVAFAFAIRSPNIDREFNGLHAWKNVRHYQFAESILRTGNPFFGEANFTRPETGAQWWLRVVEAPLVDWLLVAVFGIFGPSLPAFRITMISVNLAGIVLFFLVLRPYLGRPLALLGSALLAATPLCAYFAGNGIGEQFIYSGQVLLLAAAVPLLDGRLSWRREAAFVLACVFLVLSKVTTGFMVALLAFVLVHVALAAMYRDRVGPVVARHRRAVTVAAVVLAAAVGVGGWAYLSTLDRYLLVSYPVFTTELYRVLFERWEGHMGTYLPVLALVALAFYTGLVARRLIRGRSHPGLSAFEAVALILFAVNLGQFAVQSRPFLAHEYYSVTWVVPFLVLGLAFVRHVLDLGRPALTLAVVSVLVAGIAASTPAAAKSLRWLYTVEQVTRSDRDALRTFFESRRRHGQERTLVISREPRWGYFADVDIDLRYDWQGVVERLRRTRQAVQYLKSTGIQYVIYPRYAIPDSVLAGLDRDPLVDPGPEYFKLGMVLRGRDMFVFKITTGIARREPLTNGNFARGTDLGWRVVGGAFTTVPEAAGDGRIAASGDQSHGCLLSDPFVASGDAVLFRLRGSPLNADRVELVVDGEPRYRLYPFSEDELDLFAVDVAQFRQRQVYLKVVDSSARENARVAVAEFEQIWYE